MRPSSSDFFSYACDHRIWKSTRRPSKRPSRDRRPDSSSNAHSSTDSTSGAGVHDRDALHRLLPLHRRADHRSFSRTGMRMDLQ